MKISNSKKQLAKIIHENGGWRDGAEFAWYGNLTEKGWFGRSKPWYVPKEKSFRIRPKDDAGYFPCRKLHNWHQTVLSREEYFHLYPAPDADGWIEWNGGECPVDRESLVDYKLLSGSVCVIGEAAGGLIWRHGEVGSASIIAYRLHKPEQAKPELYESVAQSIPEYEIHSKNIDITKVDDIDVVESKPTIEQLAADYRNAKDYAERKQQEADDAKADADEKLRVLELAGEALGLLVSPITEKQGPGLVAAKFTGKFHSAKHGDRPISLDMVCDGCGKRFGHHVGFECRP